MLEKLFQLQAHNTTVRTELLAGLTTFLTMAYILFVNPSLLSEAGMDRGAVFVATCLAAAIGSAIMGLVANYPIALAPGMGLNAFFTYTVVLHMGHTWQVALGAVFISATLFFLLSIFRIREWIVNSIPLPLRSAIAAGIGLFLALIALKEAGLVVDNPATLVGLGDLHSPGPLLAVLGFFLIVALEARRVTGAVMIGILVVTAIAIGLGVTPFGGVTSMPPSLAPTFLQLDIKGALDIDLQNQRRARGELGCDLAHQRAVAVTVDLGPLNKLTVCHAAVELLARQKKVVDAVDLTFAWCSRGSRNRQAQVRAALAHTSDERTLACA